MYGGWPPRLWVAYVGEGGNLAGRIEQHFVRRDSSVATGVAAATLNPDAVREVRWWQHPSFDTKVKRQAAELVAFRVLDPALRSRGGIGSEAKALAADPAFAHEMEALFLGQPTGIFTLPWLWDMETRIEQLEQEVANLKKRLDG
jgi:hypothetical protein